VSTEANPVAGKTVVLAVTGGIAAYKAAELARAFIKAGATVRAAMTESAQEFIGPMTLQALTGAAVATDLFDLTQESDIGHIKVADGADIIVVAPATANTIARMAAGLADNIVTAIALATRAPILLAPAMNVNMWEDPATQHNVRTLVDRGMQLVGPGEGFLACRWIGPGRMAEPPDVLEAACHVLTPQDLSGRSVVVSAGPTHEPLDPVRFIGNRSSGRMGYAIALAAARRGASVTLVSGPAGLDPPGGVELVSVVTAREMNTAVQRAAKDADAVIMAAAVGDFRPVEAAAQKIKKRGAGSVPTVELEQNPDILAGLGEHRSGKRPVLVGFAAETENVVAYAERKLEAKRCDLMVANDVSQPDAGFDVETNRVTLIGQGAPEPLELASKDEVAHVILDRVVGRLGS
jgi:phosphopantothenoylcysteine decarboxylase/phosphopantothenate--cysteine ligase